MWTSPEEARSDFILAAAVALFGPLILRLISPLLNRIAIGVLDAIVTGVILFALTGLVPVLLARYRGDGLGAFGLDGDREGLLPGALVGLPIVAVSLYGHLQAGRDPLTGLLGSLAFLTGSPTEMLTTLVSLVAVSVGLVLLYSFLTVKGRDGFARNEVSQLEMLRTFGMGAAGLGLLIGFLAAATPAVTILRAIVDAVALVAMILVADRYIAPNATTTRAAILGPAIIALLVVVNLFGGGMSGLLITLRHGVLAAGVVMIAAVLVESRKYAWAIAPLFVILTLYRTGHTPF